MNGEKKTTKGKKQQNRKKNIIHEWNKIQEGRVVRRGREREKEKEYKRQETTTAACRPIWGPTNV